MHLGLYPSRSSCAVLGLFLRAKPVQGEIMPTAQTPRILLTDKAVKGVPFSTAKPQIVRDSKIAGFHLWVGNAPALFASLRDAQEEISAFITTSMAVTR